MSIQLREALEQTGRINEVCVHCGKPLFYDIDNIYVNIKNGIIKYDDNRGPTAPHLKWLIDGVRVDGKIYYRDVCWDCFFKTVREASKNEQWTCNKFKGWFKDILNGKNILPPGKMSTIGKKKLPLMFTKMPKEAIIATSKKYDSASLESFIRRYGEVEGRKKYNEYVSFHAIKNSYEWKQEHNGWTKEQYDEYNKSRSVTKQNLIRRYGEKDGIERFNSYCKWQAYAGCSIEYFKELYGEVEGKRFYQELNKRKANNIEAYKIKYGDEEGTRKWNEWVKHCKTNLLKYPGYSEESQRLFHLIISELDTEIADRCRFAEHGGEVVITLSTGRAALPDFLYDKKIIEFNGDYWHKNPELYTGDLITEDVKQIWQHDRDRISELQSLGYEILVIWELDFSRDAESIIKQCVEFIKK